VSVQNISIFYYNHILLQTFLELEGQMLNSSFGSKNRKVHYDFLKPPELRATDIL